MISYNTKPGNAAVVVKNSNYTFVGSGRKRLIDLEVFQLSEEETLLFYWYSPYTMGTKNDRISNCPITLKCPRTFFVLIYSFGFNVGKFA